MGFHWHETKNAANAITGQRRFMKGRKIPEAATALLPT
jgi:hypothetical protein